MAQSTGRPRINLDPYRSLIQSRLQARTSISDILTELTEVYHVAVKERTLRNRIQTWGFKPLQGRTIDSESLRRRIAELWFEQGLSDQQMYTFLTEKENWVVTLTGVERTRRQMNIFRRRNDQQISDARNYLYQFFEDEQYLENLAARIGRNMLHVHLRQRMVDIPRAILSEVYPYFHQASLDERRNRSYRRRGGWTCYGPNFMWSIDGYMKLSRYGIECYASIDAYSRYIVWFFCGISATTARIVLAQYISMVQQYQYMPLLIRADRGRETALIAGAHYYLSRNANLAQRPERPYTTPRPNHHQASLFGNRQVPVVPIRTASDEHTDTFEPDHISSSTTRTQHPHSISEQPLSDLSFAQCWIYGKSTYNVKIERWWGSLCEGRSKWWRNFFSQLEESGMWSKHDLADRIALLYIYMPRVRYEFAQFVRLWNAHYIRKQKSRPHVVPGKPWVLYNLPNTEKVKDYRVQAPIHLLQELQSIVEQDGIDLDKYLPDETMKICDDIVRAFGGLPEHLTPQTRAQPYLVEYDRLRFDLRKYLADGLEPKPSLVRSQTGSLAHLRTWLNERGVNVNNLDVESEDETDIEIV